MMPFRGLLHINATKLPLHVLSPIHIIAGHTVLSLCIMDLANQILQSKDTLL